MTIDGGGALPPMRARRRWHRPRGKLYKAVWREFGGNRATIAELPDFFDCERLFVVVDDRWSRGATTIVTTILTERELVEGAARVEVRRAGR